MVKIDERIRQGETVLLGFVGFVSGDSAQKAVEEKEMKVLDNIVKNTYARSYSRRNGGQYFSKTRLYVSGIGKLEEDELSKLLGKCNLIWPKDAKNAKNPYVFAQYENEEDKKDAMDKLNGKKIDEENTLRLSPAYAQKFGQRVGDRRRRF